MSTKSVSALRMATRRASAYPAMRKSRDFTEAPRRPRRWPRSPSSLHRSAGYSRVTSCEERQHPGRPARLRRPPSRRTGKALAPGGPDRGAAMPTSEAEAAARVDGGEDADEPLRNPRRAAISRARRSLRTGYSQYPTADHRWQRARGRGACAGHRAGGGRRAPTREPHGDGARAAGFNSGRPRMTYLRGVREAPTWWPAGSPSRRSSPTWPCGPRARARSHRGLTLGRRAMIPARRPAVGGACGTTR